MKCKVCRKLLLANKLTDDPQLIYRLYVLHCRNRRCSTTNRHSQLCSSPFLPLLPLLSCLATCSTTHLHCVRRSLVLRFPQDLCLVHLSTLINSMVMRRRLRRCNRQSVPLHDHEMSRNVKTLTNRRRQYVLKICLQNNRPSVIMVLPGQLYIPPHLAGRLQ